MDRASQALVQGIPYGVRKTYRALAEYYNVARSTLHDRLTLCEEKAIVNLFLLMTEYGQPVRIKHIPSLAFSIACQQSTNKPPKPPGKNWARAFENVV
ncbi:hypothetical protein K505DRAFT_250642 [Melanomma pulvis-pyrius CBS 109.77]|uniref:Uncharacterized protein n=1 Tax=Melanomma pulvis-pyrius CBS 109.77 TaxID=1314802 RepID=A0A6A6X2X1_9PLEO|nr:hypothetical protein K505DRAFT_250642 [Melanomma pulvis-pyrius CBS 109.77]